MRIETKVLPASEEAIGVAARILAEGGLVAFPTDTVYGVGAHAFQPDAVERIYMAKIRPRRATAHCVATAPTTTSPTPVSAMPNRTLVA